MRNRLEASFARPRSVYAGFGLLLVMLVSISVFISRQSSLYAEIQQFTRQQALLSRVPADLVDAETGQRGYLLTNEKSYLGPYQAALARFDADFNALSDVADGASGDHGEIESLRGLANEKLAELRATIDLHDANKPLEALARVRAGIGKAIMDRIRERAARLNALQQQRIDARLDAARVDGNVLRVGAVAAVLAELAVAMASIGRLQNQVAAITAARDELREANTALSAEAQRRAQLADQLQGYFLGRPSPMSALIVGGIVELKSPAGIAGPLHGRALPNVA
jgi:CHASE3 domain sensor protein